MPDLETSSQRINLVDSTGAISNYSPEDADLLLGSGDFRIAAPQEVDADLERQEFGEATVNALQTFGESTLSGATLGLSDVAARAIAPEYAEGLAKRREYNPTADVIGQGVGLIGSTFATGGESLLAKGAQAATAPARGLMAAGAAATGAVARVAGKEAATTVLGRAAATGLSMAAGGAVEGGLFGAAKIATDDYLRDGETTAERVVIGAGLGAVWGGAIGGGLGLAGGLAVGGAKKLGSMFDAGAKGKLGGAKQLEALTSAEAVAKSAARTDADASIAQQVGFRSDDQIVAELSMAPTATERSSAEAILRKMGKEADAAKEFDIRRVDAVHDARARGNRINRTADDLQEAANVSLKPKMFEALMDVSPPDHAAIVPSTAAKLDDITAALEEASGSFQNYTPAGLNGMTKAKKAIDNFHGEVFKRMENVDTNAAAARYKADVDTLKRNLGRIQNGMRSDPNARAIVRDSYHQLMEHLEDGIVWGDGSTRAQREINAAWSRYLDYSDTFSSTFGLRGNTRSARDGFEKVPEIDPAKVKAFIGQLGDEGNIKNEEVWAIGLERKADLLDTLSKWYDVPEGMKASVASARRDTQEMVAKMRELRALNETAQTYRSQVETVRDLPFGGEQLAKIKVTAGKVVSFASKTDARAAGRAAAESGADASGQAAVSMATNGERAAESASKGVIRWVAEAAKGAASGTARAARTSGEAIAKYGPLMGVNVKLNDPATYERVVRNISAMNDPQSDERATVRNKLSSVRRSNPALADALENHAQRVSSFLLEKAGELSSVPRSGDPFGGLRKPRHDPAKAAKLARYVDAAQNPKHALERIEDGQILREDVETLKALYPRMYKRVVDAVLSDLGTIDVLPPYAARLKLGHLLDAPADPSMRPDNVGWLQGIAASKAQEQAADKESGPAPAAKPPGKTPKLGGLYQTRTQDLVGDRQ